MSLHKKKMNHSSKTDEASEYVKIIDSDPFENDSDFFAYHADHAAGGTFASQNLSSSDYAKVLFCDLYYNDDSTVGCRFQITDNVHEDPCDYIGLFRVGFDNLSQCLAAKMLSQTDCEEDGKMLRCTFKPSESPELENGFYQFLYVTRESEICGASMPFQIKHAITKDLNSDEDIVAESSEDDFIVVRSNMAEKNRRLQALLDEMTEKCLRHEDEMRKIQLQFKVMREEKIKLDQCLKKACEEKVSLFNESQRIAEEKNILCTEKEEAIRILKEKNKVFSSMFDNYSDRLREFTDLKDALEADKNLALVENLKLQERIEKLFKDLQKDKKTFEIEQEKNAELALNMQKEILALTSQLEDARLMIEVLEKNKKLSMDELTSLAEEIAKLQDKLKDIKCENLILKTRLSESLHELDKEKEEKQGMLSEISALKLHIIEVHSSRASRKNSNTSGDSIEPQEPSSSKTKKKSSSSKCYKVQEASLEKSGMCDDKVEKNESSSTFDKNSCKDSKFQEESIQTEQTNEELQKLKEHCDELHAELKDKEVVISRLNEELIKTQGVVEFLSKERDSMLKNESMKQQALDECILRLNEASEIYKKQFRKIEKLKKKLNKNGADFMEKSSSASLSIKDTCSVTESADETSSNAIQLPQIHNSDSDTGEHVLRHPVEENLVVNAVKELVQKRISSLSGEADARPSCSNTREVPELQTLIEMNLEKFKNSKSKEDEDVLYAIPCPVCDQDVGVFMSSTDEMLKHLEVQHKQQICPVCGRLFDMTLPAKYFLFHVDDHFMKGDRK